MKKVLFICIMTVLYGFIYANEECDKNYLINNKKWNDDIFDLRLIDIPQIGIFYCFNDKNLIYRMSLPMAFPLMIITPINVTYATSYWGINFLLADVSFSFVQDEWELLGNKTPGLKFSDLILFRFLPFEVWNGIPLSSKGMGVYVLLELAPFNIFSSLKDKLYYGIGLNTGFKYIISRHMELELKYENYFLYSNMEIDKEEIRITFSNIDIRNYIGITFKYRLFEPKYYGVW